MTVFALVPAVPCAVCADNGNALFRLTPLGFGASGAVPCPLCTTNPVDFGVWRYWLGPFLDGEGPDA